MGLKLGGCGIKRDAAASRIIPARNRKRGLSYIYLSFWWLVNLFQFVSGSKSQNRSLSCDVGQTGGRKINWHRSDASPRPDDKLFHRRRIAPEVRKSARRMRRNGTRHFRRTGQLPPAACGMNSFVCFGPRRLRRDTHRSRNKSPCRSRARKIPG